VNAAVDTPNPYKKNNKLAPIGDTSFPKPRNPGNDPHHHSKSIYNQAMSPIENTDHLGDSREDHLDQEIAHTAGIEQPRQ